MRVFISGISGTAMGPLALMAKEAGIEVCGTDLQEGAVTRELVSSKVEFKTGTQAQDGAFLKEMNDKYGVDWFVYTSALPENHPELTLAKSLGIRVSKRDELIAYLIDKMGLSLVAVAGTHGKTTTTSMIIWACKELNIPISYLVGTTLPFAEAGQYDPESSFMIYEADEYDRNFLHFSPWLAVITTVSFDHPDIYQTREDYKKAFLRFESQSDEVLKDVDEELLDSLTVAGPTRRYDAALAVQAVEHIVDELDTEVSREEIIAVMNQFPGGGRRFERILDGVYSDYGHHPEEIIATIETAREEAEMRSLRGVVVIYEPHQNIRQHEVFDGYHDAFVGADRIFWLPTYLTREDPKLSILYPPDFIAGLKNSEVAEPAAIGPKLAEKLKALREGGYLILLMSAGPADAWLRKVFDV